LFQEIDTVMGSLFLQSGGAMRSLIKSLCLILLFSIPCTPAAQNGVLHGTVMDSHGVPLPQDLKPRIFIHWDESGMNIGLKSNVGISQDMSLETDSDGKFEVNLPSGFYDVFVSAFGFSPRCRKIRIHSGESIDFDAKLDVNLGVQKELADRPF